MQCIWMRFTTILFWLCLSIAFPLSTDPSFLVTQKCLIAKVPVTAVSCTIDVAVRSDKRDGVDITNGRRPEIVEVVVVQDKFNQALQVLQSNRDITRESVRSNVQNLQICKVAKFRRELPANVVFLALEHLEVDKITQRSWQLATETCLRIVGNALSIHTKVLELCGLSNRSRDFTKQLITVHIENLQFREATKKVGDFATQSIGCQDDNLQSRNLSQTGRNSTSKAQIRHLEFFEIDHSIPIVRDRP